MKSKLYVTALILSGIISLALMLYYFPSYQKQLNDIVGYDFKIFDLHFSYSKAELYKVYDDMGEEGRAINIFISGKLDIFYPLAYGIFFILIILGLAKNYLNKKIRLLYFVPITVIILDFIENFGFLKLLYQFPNISEEQVNFNSTITSMKWLFVFATLLVIFILFRMNYRQNKSTTEV